LKTIEARLDSVLFQKYYSYFRILTLKDKQKILFDLMIIVFKATFSNISAISWRPVLVVEEAVVPGENHRLRANNW
jgi:hypothetical protein